MILGLALLALSSSAVDAAQRVYVRKKGGGASGYNSIRESHVGDNHYLSCRDPGNEICKWEVQPASSISFVTLNEAVEGRISAGEFSGTLLTPEGYSAIWEGTDPYNVSIDYAD